MQQLAVVMRNLAAEISRAVCRQRSLIKCLEAIGWLATKLMRIARYVSVSDDDERALRIIAGRAWAAAYF